MVERSANGPSIARCNRYAIADSTVGSAGAVRPRMVRHRAALRTLAPPAGNECPAGTVDVERLLPGFINPDDGWR